MKYYDVITKRGNTYRIDENNYALIMHSISQGKTFVMVNETPVNITNIAEIPRSKYTEAELINRNRHLKEGKKNIVSDNSPGYKSFKKARAKLIKKLGGKR